MWESSNDSVGTVPHTCKSMMGIQVHTLLHYCHLGITAYNVWRLSWLTFRIGCIVTTVEYKAVQSLLGTIPRVMPFLVMALAAIIVYTHSLVVSPPLPSTCTPPFYHLAVERNNFKTSRPYGARDPPHDLRDGLFRTS